MTDALTLRGVEVLLPPAMGLRLRVFETVESTNTLAAELARSGEPEGLALLASSQTGGRGRRGRSFFSPSGTGLYMSLLLRPKLPPEQAVSMTAAAAVAVCRALERVAEVRPSIKWVNDVLLDGKKVCGILTEAESGQNGLEYAVVGVGINVYAPPGGFPEELRDIAGSLLNSPVPGLRDRLAAAFLTEFMELYRNGGFFDEYARRVTPPGTPVTVLSPLGSRDATVLGIDGSCQLRVRYDGGGEELLSSGEISIRAK